MTDEDSGRSRPPQDASAQGIAYQGAFGRRDLASGAAMTLDTVCWIASMTKTVTAVACMQLVEQGKLRTGSAR